MWWATDVGIAFKRVEEGFETALKDYNKKQVPMTEVVIKDCIQQKLCVCDVDVSCFLFPDNPAELTNPHAARRFNSWRQTENYDHLHDRCPRSGCCCQSHCSEGSANLIFHHQVLHLFKASDQAFLLVSVGDDRTVICLAVTATPSLG